MDLLRGGLLGLSIYLSSALPLLQYFLFSVLGLLVHISLRNHVKHSPLLFVGVAGLFAYSVGFTLLSFFQPLLIFFVGIVSWYSWERNGSLTKLQLLFPEIKEHIETLEWNQENICGVFQKWMVQSKTKIPSDTESESTEASDNMEVGIKQEYLERWLAEPIFWALQSVYASNHLDKIGSLSLALGISLAQQSVGLLPGLCVLASFFRDLYLVRETTRQVYKFVGNPYGFFEPVHATRRFLSLANWPMVIYMFVMHAISLHMIVQIYWNWMYTFGLSEQPGTFQLSLPVFLLTILLMFGSGMGVTLGNHRLFAHRSYTATLPVRFVLLILSSIANQGCVYHWARDHRVHHLYSDSEGDPHDSFRGFFFSHMGWFLIKKAPEVNCRGRTLDISDLDRCHLIQFQRKLDPFWNFFWCFGFPSLAYYALGQDIVSSFYISVFKYMVVLHTTWCVNSVVHTFGTRPYAPFDVPTENRLVALISGGEGWHSYHHAFPQDYATSELGILEQFNISKFILDVLALFGLVSDLKRYTKHWETRLKLWEAERSEKTGIPHKAVLSLHGPPFFKVRKVTFVPLET